MVRHISEPKPQLPETATGAAETFLSVVVSLEPATSVGTDVVSEAK
jgi:hypothetical protein